MWVDTLSMHKSKNIVITNVDLINIGNINTLTEGIFT